MVNKKQKLIILSAILILAGFLFVGQTLAAYETSGSLTSTNLLDGLAVSSIDSFVYNLSSKPANTEATIQFSQDNSNWYNSSGVLDGTDTLTTGINTIILSGLSWSGPNFYYKITFTSDGTDTPVLDNIAVNYSSHEICCCSGEIECQRNYPIVGFDGNSSKSGNAGDELTYIVSVSNEDNALSCELSTFELSLVCPSGGWTCSLDLTTLDISPGYSATTILRVTSPYQYSRGDYEIPITATNKTAEDNGEGIYTGTNSAIYQVANNAPWVTFFSVNSSGICFSADPFVELSWEFHDIDSDTQFAYQVQIDNNSDFLSPESDSCSSFPSTCDGNSSDTYVPIGLAYDSSYHWRVRVWDIKGLLSDCGNPEGWCYPAGSFLTIYHAYPVPDFSWNPESPAVGQLVQFCSVYEEEIVEEEIIIVCPENLTIFNDFNPSGRIWKWSFGDETIDYNSNPSHPYTEENLEGYIVSLSVWDSSNFGPCTISTNISVRKPLPEWEEIPPILP